MNNNNNNNKFITNATGPVLSALEQLDPSQEVVGFPIPQESVCTFLRLPDGRLGVTESERYDKKRNEMNFEVETPCGKVETDGQDYSDTYFLQLNAEGNVERKDTARFQSESLVRAGMREFLEECSGAKDPQTLSKFAAAIGKERLDRLYAESTKIYLMSTRDGVFAPEKKSEDGTVIEPKKVLKGYNTLVTIFVLHVDESFLREINQIMLQYPKREHARFFACNWKIETKEETKDGKTKTTKSLVLVSENNDQWPKRNGEPLKVRNFLTILFRFYWEQFQAGFEQKKTRQVDLSSLSWKQVIIGGITIAAVAYLAMFLRKT